jgi:hypothetical protein
LHQHRLEIIQRKGLLEPRNQDVMNTVMKPHMKNRTVMIVNGPRQVGPPSGEAEDTVGSTDGPNVDRLLFLRRQQRTEHPGKNVGLAHETEIGGV